MPKIDTYYRSGGREGLTRELLTFPQDLVERVAPPIWDRLEQAELFALAVTCMGGVFCSLSGTIQSRLGLQLKIKIMSEETEMPKKIGEWKGFADIPLSKADKVAAKQYAGDGDKVLTDLENLVGSQYKLTVSVDTRTDVHMVSISCYDKDSQNYKHTMVTRGKTAWGSLCAALYKHWHVADGKWPTQDDAEIDF